MARVVLDPVTRVEGHLRIDTRVEAGRVAEAWSRGEMFRGFEALLVHRDPLDAPVITQRICGVCPVSHAVASCRALEEALGLEVPPNGRLLRSLVLGANYLQSHILHFYHLSALDFVDVTAVLGYEGSNPVLRMLRAWVEGETRSNRILPAAPFLPRLPGAYPDDPRWNTSALSHYVEAMGARREAHHMCALFGGKMPHTASLVPGGVTCGVDPEAVEDFRSRLRQVRSFVENTYLPDVAELAQRFPSYAGMGAGLGRFLSYGAFEEADGEPWLPAGVLRGARLADLDTSRIREEVGSSRYAPSDPANPKRGETLPDPHKEGAYSWLKAPRYGGEALEVGPLARILIGSATGMPDVRDTLSSFLAEAGLGVSDLVSAAGRHAARAVEAALLARRMETWLDELVPGESSVAPYTPGSRGRGEGLAEAPRGALGHWIEIAEGRIARYQCLVPSTWNFSPRGDGGEPGPVEAALEGTPVEIEGAGLEVARVVRSFDPCIACAVH